MKGSMTIPEICYYFGGEYLNKDGILYRWVNEEWIGKPSVQTKSLAHKWFDEVTSDEIDTRYYNLDGTKK